MSQNSANYRTENVHRNIYMQQAPHKEGRGWLKTDKKTKTGEKRK